MEQEKQGFANAELLARLDFLNLELGLERCMDDEDFYLDILASFVEENQLDALKSLYLENNWAKYRIKAHTLKSSSAYIGAEELSAWAKQIELAAKEGDEEFIHRNHYHFIAYYESVLRQIDSAMSLRNRGGGNQIERLKILVVDSDLSCQGSIKQAFRDQFQVDAVNNSEQMFAYLHGGALPDMILMDISDASQDNHEALRELKRSEAFMDIPVAIMVDEHTHESMLQGISEGAAEYLIKPLRMEIVMMRINRMLQLSRLQTNLQHEVYMRTKADKEKNQRIANLLDQVVDALGRTIDAKDKYTKGHSERVAKYAVMIAKKLGCDEEQITAIKYAALLHDIGKIGIPDEIINKPESLTDKEYAIVKAHPVLGAEILHGITAVPGVYEAARWHHERYDGLGYPDGKQGMDIPDLVRIISVADAYDSMTSIRAYRERMTQAMVRAEIEKGMGTQFDPIFANIMIDIIDGDKDFELREK